MIEGYAFLHPFWLGLILLIPALIYWNYKSEKQRVVRIAVPTLSGIQGLKSWRTRLYPILKVIRYAGLIALIVAMARPQRTLKEEVVNAEGIDIFLKKELHLRCGSFCFLVFSSFLPI